MDLPTDLHTAPGPGDGNLAPRTAGAPADLHALYPDLRRLAALVADTDMDPDDLVQEALTGFLRVAPASVRDPGAYLRRAVVNAATRERRRRARARELRRTADREASVPADYPSDVAALLGSLAPVDRVLLYLLDVDGFPVADAAAVVGLSVVAARARASRARRAARHALEGGGR